MKRKFLFPFYGLESKTDMVKQTTHILLLGILMLCYISQSAIAQQDSAAYKLSCFVKNIQAFNRQYPQEKVYLHFDNTGYYLGETIWFKAYVVKADELTPTPLSRVLYVELLNPEGDIVETKKLKVENGQCHGDFQLKDSLFAGYYEVRAYTRYMLNFGNTEYVSYPSDSWRKKENKGKETIWSGDYIFYTWPDDNNKKTLSDIRSNGYATTEDCFIFPFGKRCRINESIFSRVFPVYNRPLNEGDYSLKIMRERPRVSETTEQKIKATKPFSINFYPEGGCLVAGIPSKVAFKAISAEGENIVINGIIKTSKGDEITNFRTTHEGMGSFELIPDSATYTAELYYRDKIWKFELPKVQMHGYVMSINAMHPKKLLINLLQNESNATMLGITIVCRGKLMYHDTLTARMNKPVLLSIDKADLNTGVNQITLFNLEGKILADRMVFINNNECKSTTLKITGYKNQYQPREQIMLNFNLTDSLSDALEETFSLAVRDAETEDLTYPVDNILSNLLLSSDLKGYIANPSFYFENNDNPHRFALDLLMLTQGWRRYEWKQMAKVDSFRLRQPLERGIIIDGFVRDDDRYRNQRREKVEVPNAYVKLSLILPDNQILDGDYRTDSLGRFYAFVGDFAGAGKLSLNAFEKLEGEIIRKDYALQLNRKFSPTPKPNYDFYQINIPYSNKTDTINPLVNTQRIILTNRIEEVTISAKTKKRRIIDFSKPNYRIKGIDEIDKVIDDDISIFNYVTNNTPTNLCLNSAIMHGIGDASVRILLDKKYASTNRTQYDVDSIYIYTDMDTRNKFSSEREKLGGSSPDVIICVKFYDTKERKLPFQGIRQTKLQGYSYVSEFYSPDYKNNALPEKKDFRRTLYWNPDVKTDSNGRATVSFYNNSTCKHINISAETVTNKGVPVVYESDKE